MRIFLAISCLLALAAARPDVSHLGYKYHSGFSGTTVGPTVAINSNGVAIDALAPTIAPTLAPLGLTSTVAPGFDLGLTSTIAPAFGYNGASSFLPSTPFPLGYGNSFDSFAANAIPSTLSPYGLSVAPTAFSAFGLDATAIPSTIAPYGFAAGSYGYEGAAGFIRHQTPIVSKQFYGFSAPEEPREEYHRHLVLGTPQKNYRVVFIKAPASQTATRISASFAPTEEKTVIYVLSKKPEDLQINDIQAPQPTEPSKPEVFFIKYKTPEEAANAQHQIQAQYDALGGYSKVSDEGVAPLTSVIGSLGESISEVDIANARFDNVQGVQLGAAFGAGAVHHLGSPLSTIAPAYDALSIGGVTSTLAPAFGSFGSYGSFGDVSLSTLSPYVSSTVAPFASSTFAPFASSSFAPFASSTFAPFASSTFAPSVDSYVSSTVAPFVSSTVAPFVSSTVAPPVVSTLGPAIEIGDKYLPPVKKA